METLYIRESRRSRCAPTPAPRKDDGRGYRRTVVADRYRPSTVRQCAGLPPVTTPEQRVHETSDTALARSGWAVQGRASMNRYAAVGVAATAGLSGEPASRARGAVHGAEPRAGGDDGIPATFVRVEVKTG